MIQLRLNKKGQWYFVIRATNGRVLAHSESYARKRNALQGAEAVKKSAMVGVTIDAEEQFD